MFKRSISTATAFTAIVVAMISTAQAATHLQQPTSATHVTLLTKEAVRGSPSNCPNGWLKGQNFFRVRADGTSDAAGFVVPNGQTLVVTDIEWLARGGRELRAPFVPDVGLRMDIFLVKSGADGNVVYSSPTVDVDAKHVDAVLGGTDHLIAGFVVGPGVSICPSTTQYDATSSISVKTQRVILHGYLIATP